LGYDGELLFAEHHESHAASAFFPSPFEEAAILTMDGVGEWATASLGIGRGSAIELTHELRWPDSLGLLYSAFTYYTGFKVNSGEYKVMGGDDPSARTAECSSDVVCGASVLAWHNIDNRAQPVGAVDNFSAA
jgi:hypothetical protein